MILHVKSAHGVFRISVIGSKMIDDVDNGDPFGLRPVWDALISLYEVFAGFCEQNGLRHYAAFGTALGAVRHKGFIPWDDDFDVYMPRPDYEKLFSMTHEELPNGLSLKNIGNTNGWPHYFGKVILEDDRLCEEIRKESGLSLGQGIFIDVFPLDGLPSNPIHFWIVVIIRALFRGSSKLFNKIGLGDFHAKAYNCWAASHKYSGSRFVQCYNENREKIVSRLYTADMFGVPIKLAFEDTWVLVPKEVERYLAAEFGNWEELPPVEQRVPTHQQQI